MERQKSSTERASPTGSAQCLIFSRRRSYIPAAVPVSIMSSDVFVQQLFPVFPAYSAMDSDLRLEVGEEPLKGVVGVGEASLRMVVESPQERYVALDAQIGASQSWTHVRWRPAPDPPVMYSFVDHIPVLVVPLIERPDETLLVRHRHAVHQLQQVPGCLYLGVLREIPADDEHLVELAHLDRDRLKSLRQPFHPVYHGSVYPEPVAPQPVYALHILGDGFMPDVFVPQDIATQGVPDDHQSEGPAPVGGVHLNGHILVLRYLMDMTHALQIPADGLLVDSVLDGKLLQRLLALYIVGNNTDFIPADTTVKTASAVLAFVPLCAASQAIPDHIRRPTEKAFF